MGIRKGETTAFRCETIDGTEPPPSNIKNHDRRQALTSALPQPSPHSLTSEPDVADVQNTGRYPRRTIGPRPHPFHPTAHAIEPETTYCHPGVDSGG